METRGLSAYFDENDTRDRLVLAMAQSLMEKGLADTVVADIVKRARVSRRTFYEEFSDRGECFLDLCNRTTEITKQVIAAAADPALEWEEQVILTVDAYFGLMTAEPRLTRSLLFDIYALGERGLDSHRAAHHQFTLQVIELRERSRAAGAEIRELDYASAAAIVGAIYQLMQVIADDEPRITLQEARAATIGLLLDSARPQA